MGVSGLGPKGPHFVPEKPLSQGLDPTSWVPPSTLPKPHTHAKVQALDAVLAMMPHEQLKSILSHLKIPEEAKKRVESCIIEYFSAKWGYGHS